MCKAVGGPAAGGAERAEHRVVLARRRREHVWAPVTGDRWGQQSVADTAAQAAVVTSLVKAIEALGAGATFSVPAAEPNPALEDWRADHDR